MPAASPPRVAYVLKMYPRLAETFILNEILEHEAAGLDLEVISLRAPIDGRFHEALSRVQAPVTYLPGQSVKSQDFWEALRRAGTTLPGGEHLMAFAETEEATTVYQGILLAEQVVANGITHLHAHFATISTSVARVAARLAEVPYSFTAHAKDIYHESVEPDDLRRKLRDADSVVTVSDFNLRFLEETYGQDSCRTVRIYNGLDMGLFPYNDPIDREPLVLGVGRFVDKKGFTDLIDACVELKRRGRKFRCELIGTGALREKLEQQIIDNSIGDRVVLLGARSRDEVVLRMRKAALLAAPCVISPNGNRDGLPTVLLEAMALGTPCVSTTVTGIPEVVKHESSGLLCEQHDPSSLADQIERLLEDSRLRVSLAQTARAMIEADFDINRNTPALRHLFTVGLSAGTPRQAKLVTLEVG